MSLIHRNTPDDDFVLVKQTYSEKLQSVVKKVFLSLVVLVIVAGCSTTKSKSDQSGFSKFWHDTNAQFNGYFNANELLEESIAQLDEQYQDNYNDLLPVYEYRAAPNPESVSSSLDEAIKKVSIVATLHENSMWVDDCYLLIGKAEFLKQDFESAENALEFFLDEFERDGTRSSSGKSRKKARTKSSAKKSNKKANKKSSDKRAKQAEKERKAYNKAIRKKQKRSAKGKSTEDVAKPKSSSSGNVASKRNTTRAVEAPEKKDEPKKEPEAAKQNPSGIKHRPAYQEAQLWLARTYIERENFPRAEYHFNNLEANPYLQDEVKEQLPAALAYNAIARKNYKGALPHLEQAIEYAKTRPEKARFAYIMAQIYDLEDESSGNSYKYYEMAYDYKPGYEMAFNSSLSMARTAYLSGEKSLDASIATLDRMLKEEKNDEYKDKLYFTLARVDLFQGNTDAAIQNLLKAVETGGVNRAQQTETNYLLASLYYDKNMYIEAKSAYDVTLQTMTEDDDRYELTKILSENLTDISKHLSTIVLQDSLIMISELSEDDRLALAKDLKKQQQTGFANSAQGMGAGAPIAGSAGKGKGGSKAVASAQTTGSPPPLPVVSSGQSSFFAYDDRSIRRGEREFERTWGDRPLADNWRVSASLSASATFTDAEQTDLFDLDVIDEDDLSDIFKDVPDTPEELAAAHSAIQNAMLQLGYLYREKLEDAELSVEILEELTSKYPEGESAMEANYQLYLSHIALNNDAQVAKYRQLIIDQFPGSKYALALSDPDYVNKQLSAERKLEMHYEEVYVMVESGQYSTAMETINAGRAEFGMNNDFTGKIAILEAMCLGNLESREAYIDALKNVVANYPNTEEETKARDMLLLLGEYRGNKLNIQSGSTTSGPQFRVQPNAVHYMLVTIKNYDQVNLKDAKIAVSNYNRKYHKLDRLKISSLVFDPKTGESIILVRSFKNSVEIMKYYDNVQKHRDEFTAEGAEFAIYPVSQFNYREVIKARSLEPYQVFFEENYMD